MIAISYTSKKKYTLLLLLLLACSFNVLNAQIYRHDFGTAPISSHPYTVAPATLANHLSGSSWTNSTNSWTSTAGATGEAIRLTSSIPTTITLTFNVANNFQVEITSFNFWRQRSNFGHQNWSMTINGINAGSGTVGAAGQSIGLTNVSNPIVGLSGTVTVVLSLSNSTGNGTFRLDDFALYGSVTSSCTAPVISSFSPASGPENTLVTINGSGFSNGSGTSSVKFNGVEATSFTVVSDSVIKAYVPSGNSGSGILTIITDGCEGFSNTPFTEIISTSPGNFSSDLYISELYDAQAGDGGVIELYNGTASPINLSGYTLKKYFDIGGSTFYNMTLSGIVPPNSVFLIGIGTGTPPCSITPNNSFSQGFNANDEFELLKNGIVIDNVHATPTAVGYSIIRNPNAVAPKVNFNASDWQILTTESCSGIGSHIPAVSTPPAITNPVSKVACENDTTVFTATVSNPTGFTYQWKMLNASGVWVNVPNSSPYSGANTNTLTVTPTPLLFDQNQYYCLAASSNHSIVSNAAQLNVNSSNTIPTFTAVAPICQGEALSALPLTSNNGITGSWSPALNTTATTTYTFIPSVGQCASTATMTITVNTPIVPTFTAVAPICQGETLSALPLTSNNGITGTWSPAINTTATTTYTFTPDAGQCADTASLTITVTTSIVPTFTAVAPICQGETLSALPLTSNNGIAGSWSPAINTTATTTYTFTPDAGQCASTATMTLTVTTPIIPAFTSVAPICQGETLSALPLISNNGITGTWSPAINNAATTTYTFTPAIGQCASTAALTITVTAPVVPTFTAVAPICQGGTLSALPLLSNNGITGMWSPAINTTATATYTFTPDTGQCASTATMTITVNTPTIPTFTAVAPICQGETLSPLPLTSNNGIAGTWAPALNNSATTTYTFTPDAGQCANTAAMTIMVRTPIIPIFTAVAPICQGETLSALPLTSNNGITGTWAPALNNNVTTIYTFTPDAGQCANTANMTITVNTATVPTFTAVGPICQGGPLSALPLTSNNGITGTWLPALNTTATTTYTFTPAIGQCASTATMMITVTTPIVPTFTAVAPICQGGTLSALPLTSNNGITGTWSPALNNNATTTYTFTPAIGQCASTATLMITVTPPIVPAFTAVAPICQGGTLSALPLASNNGITGTWSPALNNAATTTYTFTPDAGQCASTATMTITVNTPTVPTFTAVAPICQAGTLSALPLASNNGITGTWSPAINTTATTTYTFTPAIGQCASTAAMTITVTTPIVPTFTAVAPICQGGILSALPLTSNNGIIGTWSPALNNTATTTYTFTPDAGQCASTATMTISVNTPIVPTFTAVAPICQGGTLSALPLSSNNGITGTWSPALNNTATTTYTFTPTIGQCANTANMTITVTTPIVPTFTAVAPICQGGTLSALPLTSNNGITGTWSPALNNTATTTYTFTPAMGQCANTANMTITVTTPIVPTFTSVAPICQGGTLSALPLASNNGVTGTWSPALNNTATTTYTFTPTTGQCASTANLTITVNTAAVPIFNAVAPLCEGDSLSPLPSVSNNGINGNWSPALNSRATTTYTFTPTAGQCAAPTQLTLTVNPLPRPVLKDGFLCLNTEDGTVLLPKNLNCGIPNSNHSFSWTLDNDPLPTTTNTHLASAPGTYQVTATNLLTGCSNTATSVMGTSSLAIATASVEQDFNRNQTITIDVTGGSGNYEFLLDGGTPQDSNQFHYIQQGEYEVTVRDKNGCGELVLLVYALNYPRFFTPNGDGYNDSWTIEGLSAQQEAKIYIFDRYGKLIKAIRPSQNNSWDGTLNGRELPSTDYWFTLSYKDRHGSDKEFKAHFSLKR